MEKICEEIVKKEYSIPVTYEKYGLVKVMANSLEEALRYFDENIEEMPLPNDEKFVDGSYERSIDMDLINLVNKIEIVKEL